MIIMNKRTNTIKLIILSAFMLLAAVVFSSREAYASDIRGQDIYQLFFNFNSDSYTVEENDVITLSANTNIPADCVSVEYILSNNCAQIESYTGNFNEVRIKGNACGITEIIAEVKVKYYNEDGSEGTYVIVAKTTVNVLPGAEYISEQTVYRAAGSGGYALSVINFHEGILEWSSSNPLVASVDEKGVVNPLSEGQAYITAVLTRPSGIKESYTCSFYVTNPVISVTASNLAKDAYMNITVRGTAGDAMWYSSDTGVATVYSNVYEGQAPGAIITAVKTGSAVISVNVDGITLNCNITVTNPQLKKDFYVTVRGTKQIINVTGLNDASRVVYSTSDSRVATVSSTGVLTAKAIGYAAIVASVDGTELTVSVNVGKKKGVKAVLNALKAEGAVYSQARRMQKGYYDCSSLVWRSYAPVKIYFGDRHYAPVAANEAKYLVKHKKTVAVKNINRLNKLRPGDLLFFKGNKNGRYKNIYHVAIYMGQQGESYDGKVYSYGRMIHANGSNVSQSFIYNKDKVAVIGRPAK